MAKKDTRAGAAPGPVTVAFPNEGDFHSWHDIECAKYGIPFPGHNGATGEPEVTSQWTTAVIEPRVIDGYWTITVTQEQIDADATLKALEVLTVKYPAEPGGDTDANGQPISIIEVVPPESFQATKPPTWTDPETNITYDTTTGEVVP